MQKSNTMQTPEPVSPASFGKSVLLIDPDVDNHILHQFYLKKHKINLQYSKSLRHALWMVQENPPDLILTEIYFNCQAEYEHIFLLRRDNYIPIIVQTSILSESNENICKMHGVKDCFVKPLQWELYLQAVERCLVKST